jgi:hypothetical protein
VRQRALIHVGGPAGAGKTTLVEALLDRADHMVITTRCTRDDTLPAPREDRTGSDPELRRYAGAGAAATARYAFPATRDAHDAFFRTGFMQDYSEAVVIEGDSPLEFADVSVFVTPATAGRLLVRRKSDQPHKVDALEAILSAPGGLEAMLGRLVGPQVGEFARRQPELVEQERRKALAELTKLRSKPVPQRRMRWALADPYQGVERAQLVVVNIRDDAERSRPDTQG